MRQTQIKGHSTKHPTSALQNRQGREKLTQKLSQMEETKETGQLNSMCYPGLDPGTDRISVEKPVKSKSSL